MKFVAKLCDTSVISNSLFRPEPRILGDDTLLLASKYLIPTIVASKHASELSRLHWQSPD